LSDLTLFSFYKSSLSNIQS